MTGSTGIIVAAGNSTRMGGEVPKQFMSVAGKPMLYWSLKAFEMSECDDIIVVTNADSIDYVQTMIVRRYGIDRIKKIVAGGTERFNSVYAGLNACEISPDEDRIILIHDAARPLIKPNFINAIIAETMVYGASAAATNAVDTIRVAAEDGFCGETLDRNVLRAMQTPQAFRYSLIKPAYDAFMSAHLSPDDTKWVTDDVMILEMMTGVRTHLTDGGSCNIKVTNPEDIRIAEAFLL